tara:strand:+ start:3082 stop:4383 length:1302 start_codon:yes stop_codon:yes gene_type:complete
MKNYDVVILAGGFGTRMSKDFSDIPKPMIPVEGKPILEHLIIECKKYNRLNILIVLHHMSDKIKDYFGDGSSYGVNIKYFVEEIPMGTGGALLAVKDLLKDTFLVLYADVYSDLNIDNLFSFHFNNESEISIVVHPNDHPHDSDIVEIKDNKVLLFSPHPHKNNIKKNLVNAAMYIINKSSFLHLSDFGNTKFDIAQDMFPDLLKKGVNILAYKTSEYIKDMGTPERLVNVNQDIKNGVVYSRNTSNKRKAIFLDRDGTINIENGYINDLDGFELTKYSGNAIKMINKSKFLAICVTNQPVIARGECSPEQLERIHNKMESDLGLLGSYLDHIYYCPHHPDSGFKGEVKELKINCNCRKPKPGMLINAQEEFNLNIEDCWLIGDSEFDIGAAQNAGCKSILIGDKYDKSKIKYEPTVIKKNIYDAVKYILSTD